MYFVYAIKSLSKERIYIGHTKDFDMRLKYHNWGYVKSTCHDRPWALLALARFATRREARWLERELKRSSGKRKKWIETAKIGETP